MRSEDIEISVGRTEGGSFVRVIHVPTGRSRYQGPLNGELLDVAKRRLLQELLAELRDAGIAVD